MLKTTVRLNLKTRRLTLKDLIFLTGWRAARLYDQVLYLKHHLNAWAIGSLKMQGTQIKIDSGRILEKTAHSVAKADQFIRDS